VHKADLQTMGARLGELADYYGQKAPTAKALMVWGDALESVQWAEVAQVLTDWPKRHARFPTADQILKLAQERLSDRIEDEARRNRQAAPTLEDLRRDESPMARAFFRMYDAVYKRKVADSPREWCKNVLKSDKADEVLKRFAEQSLEQMPPEDAFTYTKKRDGKDWARRIVACHEAGATLAGTGEPINFIQLKTARMALQGEGATE
jgi:hypothetical protein